MDGPEQVARETMNLIGDGIYRRAANLFQHALIIQRLLLDITTVIKRTTAWWAGHVTRIEVPEIYAKNLSPWPESASELYQPSNCRLSTKLMPTFADRWWHVLRLSDSYGHNLGFLGRSRYFFFRVAPQLYSRGWVTPFQTHYFSENLVAPGIEPGPLDL
jgi:hypothetical protein